MFPSAFDEAPEPSSWSPSPLKRLLRHRGVYWTIAATLALAAGVAVHRHDTEARQVVERLGATTEVLVADIELAPGDPIAPLTSVIAAPVGLVPGSALGAVPDEATAGRRIPAGAVVTTMDLADPAEPGPDEATIAVAATGSTPPLTPGDGALLVVAADPFLGLEGRLVDARVISVVDERLVVAVGIGDLDDVAAALRAGGITVAAGP